MSIDWNEWARRQAGQPKAIPQPAPTQPQAAQPALPPPPPGYGYVVDGQRYVLVPLSQPQPVTAPPPPRAPGTRPYVPGQPAARAVHRPNGSGPPPRTCALVKPGTRDTYAELLDTVPDLLQGEAMVYDPQSLADINNLPNDPSGVAVNPESPADAGYGARPPQGQGDMSDL